MLLLASPQKLLIWARAGAIYILKIEIEMIVFRSTGTSYCFVFSYLKITGWKMSSQRWLGQPQRNQLTLREARVSDWTWCL